MIGSFYTCIHCPPPGIGIYIESVGAGVGWGVGGGVCGFSVNCLGGCVIGFNGGCGFGLNGTVGSQGLPGSLAFNLIKQPRHESVAQCTSRISTLGPVMKVVP